MKETPDARSLALRRLSMREYSREELRTYLERKGIDPTEAEQVVAELAEDGKVDDLRYARVVARHQSLRGKGPLYVLANLRRKGVDVDPRKVRQVYAEAIDGDELTLAQRVIDRHYPRAMEDQKEKAKAYQALIRRGFSHDIAKRCLSKRQN